MVVFSEGFVQGTGGRGEAGTGISLKEPPKSEIVVSALQIPVAFTESLLYGILFKECVFEANATACLVTCDERDRRVLEGS